jgi:GMP synthase (glutamine-hydrolysing)
MTKSCLVIEHLAIEHPGTLKPALEANGYEVVSIPAAAIRKFRERAAEADLLVVMGGPIGVYDAPEFPFLTDEIGIMRARLAEKRPVLGICLGSQLMASALDAKVFSGANGVELGWAPVQLTAQGRQHPLAAIAGNDSPVLHWHGDTFELPQGATLLASTSRYAHQAFAIGNYGLALQFHVETDAAELEQWFVAFAGDIRKLGPGTLSKLRADTAKYASDLSERNARFVSQWVSQL